MHEGHESRGFSTHLLPGVKKKTMHEGHEGCRVYEYSYNCNLQFNRIYIVHYPPGTPTAWYKTTYL